MRSSTVEGKTRKVIRNLYWWVELCVPTLHRECYCTLLSDLCTKIIVIERTRDLIYLKFVASDFFLKIISPSAVEISDDSE